MEKFFILLSWLLIGLTSCANPTPTAVPAPKLSIENAWGRMSPTMAQAGVFYLTIRNTGSVADKLTAAKSSACGTAELHESYMLANGAMGMRMLMGGIDVPANGTAELKAGGLHIMCVDKKVEFNAGVKIPLTLVFEKSGEMNLVVEIRDQGM